MDERTRLCSAFLSELLRPAAGIPRATAASIWSCISEINGETTPLDLNMEAMVRLGNPCLGRELLQRPAFGEPQRPRLVGLQAADGRSPFAAGAQLTLDPESSRPCGYITSAVYSPALQRWVGLGLVARSLSAYGQLLQARDPLRGRTTPVRVCPTIHVDPHGERMQS